MRFHLAAVISLLAISLAASLPAGASTPPVDYRPAEVGDELRDLGPQALSLDTSELATELTLDTTSTDTSTTDAATTDSGSGSVGEDPAYAEGSVRFGPVFNEVNSSLLITNFRVRKIGVNVEIWVQENLSFLPGDPRNPVTVTQEQINYLADQFDNPIYPTETAFFRAPNVHDGSGAILDDMLNAFFAQQGSPFRLPPDFYMSGDGKARTVVLVTNIRDRNFFDPSYPLYIAGFYGQFMETFLDRNVVTLDAWDWICRLGPQPPCTAGRTPRPFLYEGTLAHEYQHLLHDDQDPDEVAWINEGLADFAEWLVGYGPALESHINGARDFPENSLVQWGDQGDLEILSDYGHAYLFMLYLYEQFGQAFIQDLFRSTENSIASVQSLLPAYQFDDPEDPDDSIRDFAQVYRDYAVALWVDADYPGGKRRHYFANIDFNLNLGTPQAPNPQAFDTPGAAPWGTDYVWIGSDPKELAKLVFNGVEFTVLDTPWSSDGDTLYSGKGDLMDNWLIAEVDLSGASAARVEFDTQYQTEGDWDFGFVQVSIDGGATWTSLANEHTTPEHAPNAHPKVVANLPGFTGDSGGWVHETLDLTPYGGQRILLAFRYVTDWATARPGWYLDNVAVTTDLGIAFSHDGSSTASFNDLTHYQSLPNHFNLTFVALNSKPGKGNVYEIASYRLDELQNAMVELDRLLNQATSAVMLVTYQTPVEDAPYAGYSYEFSFTNAGPKK